MKSNNQLLVDFFFILKGWNNKPKEFYAEKKISYARFCKDAKDLLSLCDNNLELAKTKLLKIKRWADDNNLDWILSTTIKKFLEIK